MNSPASRACSRAWPNVKLHSTGAGVCDNDGSHQMDRGIFITFEGIDGSGKTTQLRLLADRLRQAGRDIVEAVEPGGTEIGRQVRAIVLDGRNTQLTPRAELLLYFASRAQNVAEVILPALAAGKTSPSL